MYNMYNMVLNGKYMFIKNLINALCSIFRLQTRFYISITSTLCNVRNQSANIPSSSFFGFELGLFDGGLPSAAAALSARNLSKSLLVTLSWGSDAAPGA